MDVESVVIELFLIEDLERLDNSYSKLAEELVFGDSVIFCLLTFAFFKLCLQLVDLIIDLEELVHLFPIAVQELLLLLK